MGSNAVFAEALPDIFDDAGEDATFTPAGGSAIPCKIFIEFSVALQPSGVEAQVWEQGTTIEALLSDAEGIGIGTAAPVQGDTFVYDGTTYTVKALLSNDKLTVKAVVT